jgi:riboflavin kinase/FMN adenylyltransferase
MAAVSLDRKPVSSTRIREAIVNGDLDAADQMLGRSWTLAGKVMQGDRLGHQLGFPTANLDATGLVLPPNGVYAAHAQIVSSASTFEARNSESFRAVLNIGFRPTISSGAPERRVEAHLLDFSGDLYDRELELTFVEKLRDEQKFNSLDALKVQITKDIEQARKLF